MSGSLFIQPSVARNSESPLVDKPKTDKGQETSPAVAPTDPQKPLNEKYVDVAKAVYPQYQGPEDCVKGTRAAVNTLMGEPAISFKYIPPISSLPNHDGYGAKNLAGIFEQSKNNWVFIGEYNPQKSDYTITDGVQPGDIVVYHSKEGPGHVATVTEVQTTPSSGGPKDGNLIVMANHPTGVFRKYEKDPENRVTVWRFKPIEDDRLRRAEIEKQPKEDAPQIKNQPIQTVAPLPMPKTEVVSQGA